MKNRFEINFNRSKFLQEQTKNIFQEYQTHVIDLEKITQPSQEKSGFPLIVNDTPTDLAFIKIRPESICI
ncbi:hypothetical protein LEAN103870_13305 [Legionella anisa]|uniref:Uncharacterized protein n=1 Tax=Legionella anisa TaxID=28082 RepID=A0AAX0WV68_9GAMM|nr:hypothetical protein [Legionella anisa]AWN74219.1 hypothetical protein DLD14_10400 [Legionella anisa]KTC72117.1 hypothetical protein Lani_1709 [Legionella anisa]MBN5934340.1 hypothetical protein [Legionella anisa]MCW8425749.1 hypothetical protein [Legionella anisa]MCW8448821.1 hypothetical protein [Legionella anisa]